MGRTRREQQPEEGESDADIGRLSTRLASLQVGAAFLCCGVPDAMPPQSSSPNVRLPDFLAIGAMKSGTTTLYRDLHALPGVFLPDKESNALLTPDPAAELNRLFRRARRGQLTGEVCPDYTKPVQDFRAAESAGRLYVNRRPPRLIFLAREPISRLLSHHHFISTQHGDANPGGMTSDLEASLRDFPELVETSRYAARLRPWIEAFGRDSLFVFRFEDYIADRVGVIARISAFLGLPPVAIPAFEAQQVFNPGELRPVATAGWRKILRHPAYRRLVRPLLPPKLRDQLRAGLLPKSPPKSPPPSWETLHALAEALKPDAAKLSHLLGVDGPLWDLDAAAKTLSSRSA